MIWLLLSIVTNTLLLLILKAFTRFGINTLQGIVVNYFVAGSIGIILSGIPVPVTELASQEWSWVPPVLGTLFISIFLLLARTAQTIGVSVATVANKMSVAIPVVLAIFLYDESVTVLKIAGLVIAVAAVYLTSISPAKEPGVKKTNLLWLPALVFLGSGIIDALVNHANTGLVPKAVIPFFISLSFLVAGVIGVFLVTYRVLRKGETFQSKSIVAGLILGIPNYFSLYGISRALDSDILESSALYPVNNMGIVVLAALGALVLFKEKIMPVNWFGIALSIGAIALIAFC